MSTRTRTILFSTIQAALFVVLLMLGFWIFRHYNSRPSTSLYVPAPKPTPTRPTASPSPKVPVSTPTPVPSPTAPKSVAKRAVQRVAEASPTPHSRFWFAGETIDGVFIPPGVMVIVNRLAEAGRCTQGFVNLPCGTPMPDGSWLHFSRCFGPEIPCPECLPVVTTKRLPEPSCATAKIRYQQYQ